MFDYTVDVYSGKTLSLELKVSVWNDKSYRAEKNKSNFIIAIQVSAAFGHLLICVSRRV